MKRLVYFLAAVAALCVASWWVCPAQGQEASNWHWTDARNAKSVVRIVSMEATRSGNEPQMAMGSGCLVGGYGTARVLTAAHVVRGAVEIQVHLYDSRWFLGKVVALDNTKDLAMIDLGKVADVEPAQIEFRTRPSVGDAMWMLGFGPDHRLSVDTGPVKRFVTMGGNSPAMDISAHARQGDSGGPVFNADGKVVGVISGKNDEPTVIAPTCYGWFSTGQPTTAADRPTVLEFTASWCPSCNSGETLAEVANVTQAGYRVQRINVDENMTLATQYHVSLLPCFVILHRGREVQRFSGVPVRGHLLNMIRRVRPQAYTGIVPDKIDVDPGHLRPIPESAKMVPVPEAVQPMQCGPGGCGPGGCPIGGGQSPGRRPGFGANRDGVEINGLLPWNRQRQAKPPVIVNVPPPAVPLPDPATRSQLDGIQAQLDAQQQQQQQPPTEPDYSGLVIGLCIAAGLVVGVVLFYIVGKN